MKLKELNETIASTCNVRAQVVTAVQNETFRQLRSALDKGERVTIPEFGIFMVKDVAGEEGQPNKKLVRFRVKTGEPKNKETKEARKKKRAEAKAAGGDEQ